MDGPTFSSDARGPFPVSRRGAFALGGAAAALLCGCQEQGYEYGGSGIPEFDDAPVWTTEGIEETFDGNFLQLPLARCPASAGDSPDITLGAVAPGKSLVLVVTRGAQPGGSVCIFCSTQTSRLISNYKKLSQHNSEVVVVFPISAPEEKVQGEAFKNRVFGYLTDPPEKVPFPITFDVGLKLVDALGIRDRLAKPATYIFDPTGKVRFAYVGKNIGDRPSVDAILKKLGEIVSETAKTAQVLGRRGKGSASS